MNKTEKRLSVALLIAAGIIILNVCMILTGTAGDLYDHLPGIGLQHEAHALFKGA